MVGEQPGRVGPVAGRLGVPDGVGHLAVPGEPSGGLPVQRRHLVGPPAAQFQPEQIREQVVVAEPRPLGVERHDERVRVLEVQQDPFRARPGGQQIRQLTVDAIKKTGAQQQVLDLAGLALQHLGEQVLRDGAVAAGELRDEPLRVGVTGQRECGQAQARGPPFGPLVQPRRAGLGQRDTRGLQQLACLALGEAQIRRADLGQLAGQAQLMQAQLEIAARGQDCVPVGGKVRQQAGELGEGVRRVQLVQIVDDHHDAAAQVAELAEHSVSQRPEIEVRCRSR